MGISVLPHKDQHLERLGLQDQVVAAATTKQELAYFNKWEQLIWVEPRGLAAGCKWLQRSIHRGRFLRVLHAAAKGGERR